MEVSSSSLSCCSSPLSFHRIHSAPPISTRPISRFSKPISRITSSSLPFRGSSLSLKPIKINPNHAKKGKSFTNIVCGVFERFTERAIKAVMFSQKEAKSMGQDMVFTQHLLLGLIAEDKSQNGFLESSIKIDDARDVVRSLWSYEGEGGESSGSATDLSFSSSTKRLFEAAVEYSRSMGYKFIAPEHIAIGLLTVDDGSADQVLQKHCHFCTRRKTKIVKFWDQVKKKCETKKPATPYIMWCKEHWTEVKNENPESKFSEMASILAAKWKALTPDEKKPYEEKYQIEKAAYAKIVGNEKREIEAMKLLEEEQKQKTAMELLEQYLQFKQEAEKEGDNKKNKKEKDPLKPKRAESAYFLFMNERRAALVAESKSPVEIAKITGEEWKNMTEKQKSPYEKVAMQKNEKYTQEMEVYKQNKEEEAGNAKKEEGRGTKRDVRKSRR